ncbi:MAG: beta-propeller domain-containing protein, partial [Nitrosarchaeum sp.]
MNTKILGGIVAAIIVIGGITLYSTLDITPENTTKSDVDVFTETKLVSTLDEKDALIKFTSYDEIKEFLKDSQNQQYQNNGLVRRDMVMRNGGIAVEPAMLDGMPQPSVAKSESALDSSSTSTKFSGTNVQVKNVDEPDYLKTDGKYMYIVNQNWLTIIDAYPAENAKVILKIALDIDQQNLENIFLNG